MDTKRKPPLMAQVRYADLARRVDNPALHPKVRAVMEAQMRALLAQVRAQDDFHTKELRR